MKCLSSRQGTQELTRPHSMVDMTHTGPVEAAGTAGMFTRGPCALALFGTKPAVFTEQR